MSWATCSARASRAAAAALRYEARFAIGSAAQPANADSAAATASSTSCSLEDATVATTSEGRIGLRFSYVSPDAAGRHSPAT